MAGFANAVTIHTLDEQISQMNQTVFRFRVVNTTNDTLRGIELRYGAVQDSSKIAVPDLYYLPDGMANWSFEDSVHATLVIYFPNVVLYPGDTLGGSSGYAVGLHNKDWSAWTKNDDPSQPASNKFSMTNNVEVLSGGNSIRQEVGKVSGCPVVQFVEITASSVSLQVLHRLNSDSSSVVVKNKDGLSVTANLNDALMDSLNQKIWSGAFSTQDTSEHRGELFVECGGNLLAYFAYGWRPSGAGAAEGKKLWETADAFVKADFDMGFNRGLANGQRLALQKDSMRDRSSVFGNLETGETVERQSSTPVVSGKIIEHSSQTDIYSEYCSNLMDGFIPGLDFSIDSLKAVNAGESYGTSRMGSNSSHTDYNFNSNSELKFDRSGEFGFASLKFQKDARLQAPTESVILYIGNDFQWNGTIVADDMVSAAQHLMIYYYGSNRVYIQTNFAGTIIAPNAEVVIGQSGKEFYGAIFAKSIVVHQNTKITWVPFVSNSLNTTLAMTKSNLLIKANSDSISSLSSFQADHGFCFVFFPIFEKELCLDG